MDEKIARLGQALVRILNKSHANLKTPRHYGLSERLYPAEIHMIMLIGQFPMVGVTELAAKTGTTKGAVSQIIQKLENKGLIERLPDPQSGRRVMLQLTSKGDIAYYSHEKLHEESDQPLINFLKSLDETQLELIGQFLTSMEEGIDKRSET